MRFRHHITNNVAVFELTGNILGGRGPTALRETIIQLTKLGTNNILLDLMKVNSVNAEGQKTLIENATIVKTASGRMGIINIENIDSLLAVTKLATHMEYFDTREEAMAALGSTETELVPS